jgi:hypothetical protein
VFWVISVYFNIRNTLPKFCPFLLGHPVYINSTNIPGASGTVVVKALRHKSEGPWIDSRCRRAFPVTFDSSMCPGVDSASKNDYQVNPAGKGGRCVRLTTYHVHVQMSRNLGALTCWNPVGLFRPVMGQLYLYLYLYL